MPDEIKTYKIYYNNGTDVSVIGELEFTHDNSFLIFSDANDKEFCWIPRDNVNMITLEK